MEDQQGSARWAPVIAGVVLAALALAAVAAFISSSDTPDIPASGAKAEAERGTACGSLEAAGEALEDENASGVAALLQEARRTAVRSLNEDRVLFGKPERLALQLASRANELSDSGEQEELRPQLEAAAAACEELKTL